MRYRLQRILGPVKIPSQKIMLPNVSLSLSHLVLLNFTNYRVTKLVSP